MAAVMLIAVLLIISSSFSSATNCHQGLVSGPVPVTTFACPTADAGCLTTVTNGQTVKACGSSPCKSTPGWEGCQDVGASKICCCTGNDCNAKEDGTSALAGAAGSTKQRCHHGTSPSPNPTISLACQNADAGCLTTTNQGQTAKACSSAPCASHPGWTGCRDVGDTKICCCTGSDCNKDGTGSSSTGTATATNTATSTNTTHTNTTTTTNTKTNTNTNTHTNTTTTAAARSTSTNTTTPKSA